MDLLIVLIPGLPLAGFLFSVLVGARLDHVPTHGHAAHDAQAHPVDAHAHPAEGHDPHNVPATDLVPLASEELQAETSPHAGHADDLANAQGADGVIPEDLNDGLGQTGHVTPGGPQPHYRSWIVPTLLVGISWIFSMIVFANVVFGGNTYHVGVDEWIAAGDFHIQIAFLVDPGQRPCCCWW